MDDYTRKLVKLEGVKQPSSDFTKSVMGQILKNPEVKVSFITKDDKKTNLWLFIAVGVMIVGYVGFYLLKNGFSSNTDISGFKVPGFLNVFTSFFVDLFNELSFSPFILLALIGVIVLVIMDKTIVKYIYSI